MMIGRARKKARKAGRHDPLRQLRQVPDPDRADQLDRARDRSASVRTVSGGLPTLGRHQ
ncbi:hypothetical protein ACFPIJ_40575 [Dactylosporangium cerinum]|uniref:Uncharacterized protein n=1 Tax=Dactylosporangium cerinum TaxID=1434730 RepID=A0ABV9W6H1_9ACTN